MHLKGVCYTLSSISRWSVAWAWGLMSPGILPRMGVYRWILRWGEGTGQVSQVKVPVLSMHQDEIPCCKRWEKDRSKVST